ncbi:mannose-6-phosphate isomerase-like protein (cupin superfamily) [Rhodoferax ferrireducens]|uniref:Mannose-6-phosphate isomerase-like protein (Cupin superfamily) n=1 Tax=Rhodoferax ferrireducens TaxID=192843 RepID=A0ABU2C5N6_9BURK|nr:cupin domain-containing protein [Rhodoferax ferrireducens]MDR7376638.1 mannose-6-phosphate isomerase-like protein (cupin superfamily) [Rhodoferax ferrireducens]
MPHIPLTAIAAQLPQAWTSQIQAYVGTTRIKVLRMDGCDYPDETHDYAEGLLVLEGEMQLTVQGALVTVAAGELYLVPAGTPHAVAPGSYGTLVILDV